METSLSHSSLQNWLALRNRAKVYSGDSNLPEVQVLKNIVKEDVRSWVCAPIFLQNRLAGSIELASTDPKKFHETDQRAVERIAQQASLAINNARLYVKLLDSLKEISDARKEVERVRRDQYL